MSTDDLSRRRFLSAVGFAGLSVGLAGACGSSGPGDDDDGGGETLEVWALTDEALNPVEQAGLDRFNEAGGASLKLVTFPNAQYSERLRVAMGSSQAPDIFFNWGQGSIRPYVENDQLLDLTPSLDGDPEWKQSFLTSVLDAGKLDGKYYGVPMRGMQPVLLYYNKGLFDEAGQSPPQTYDDLLNLVDVFAGRDIQPFALAGADAWTELMYLEYLADRIGGAEVFRRIAAGEPGAWGDPAIVDTLTKIQELVEAGAFGSNFGSVAWDGGGAQVLFNRGRAAMHLMGTWEFTDQQREAPEFVEQHLAYITFPTVAGGRGDIKSVVGNPTNYYSVNAESADPDAAVEFLKQEMSSPEYVDALIENGDVPAVTGIESKLGSLHQNPGFAQDVYKMVQDAPTFTLSWDQALPDAVSEVMLIRLQEIFNRQISPDQFVEALESAG